MAAVARLSQVAATTAYGAYGAIYDMVMPSRGRSIKTRSGAKAAQQRRETLINTDRTLFQHTTPNFASLQEAISRLENSKLIHFTKLPFRSRKERKRWNPEALLTTNTFEQFFRDAKICVLRCYVLERWAKLISEEDHPQKVGGLKFLPTLHNINRRACEQGARSPKFDDPVNI